MRFLRHVDVCGRQFQVIEVSSEENPALENCDGLCDSSQAIIYISPGSAETVRIDTLMHEVMHACIEATGLRVKITEASRAVGDEDGIALEENVVTVLTPALRAALKSAGWREPKRVEGGRRRACKADKLPA